MDSSEPLSSRLRRWCPLVNDGEWAQTSPEDWKYNCAAWAAGVTTANWWPHPDEDAYYWPAPMRDGSLDAFEQGYAALGYHPCRDGSLEEGVEKIVVYATSRGSPQHVARQLADGTWTSKLGELEDISHADPRSVAGGDYGQPVLFLSRARPELT